jgi:hypothetical protein
VHLCRHALPDVTGHQARKYRLIAGHRPVEAKEVLDQAPGASWAGFQVYYPMPKKEVRSSSGVDLIESMMAIFEEVTPAMNLCMQIQLK